MKKLFLYSSFVVLSSLFFVACSNDDSYEQIDFNNLKYVVNVSTGDDASSSHKIRSKANSKLGWDNNDCIFMSADGSAGNIYKLTFDGTDWDVVKAVETAKFNGTSGKVNAVFSNKSSYKDAGEVLVEGDILYTDEGTYKIEDNIVFINLKMNKRPISRIEIKGVADGFWIEELKNYSGVNVSNLSLIENKDHYIGQKEDGGGVVYYGVLPEDADGNFTLTLTNKDGLSCQRTYKGKTLSAGDHIVINGPASAEANDWNIILKGIQAVESNINMKIGTTGKISDLYVLVPENATNKEVEATSSNSSVVKINADGTYTTMELGDAVITIKTKDGNHSCQIQVNVKDVPFFISAIPTGGAIMSINGVIQRGSSLNWQFKNNSTKTVHLKTLQLIDGQTGSEGNQMDANVDVVAGSQVSYSTTIGLFGIHTPVTCRFRYEYNNKEYYVDAVYN